MSLTDWDRVSKQKMAYCELDRFVPGEGGLTYYPIPESEKLALQQNKIITPYPTKKKRKKKKTLEERKQEVIKRRFDD